MGGTVLSGLVEGGGTTPAELAALADLVVSARVAAVSEGTTQRDRAGGRRTERVVTLRVIEVLDAEPGRSWAPEATVRVIEGFWDERGEDVVTNGVPWSSPGDEGIYFLTQVEGDPLYRLVSSCGRLLYPSSRSGQGPSGDDVLAGVWRSAGRQIRTLEEAADFVAEVVAAL